MLRRLMVLSLFAVVFGLSLTPAGAGNVPFTPQVPIEDGSEYDGYYPWDVPENWSGGSLPVIANNDDAQMQGSANGKKILVDDLFPDAIKECVNYKSWKANNTELLIDSTVEGGPGGVLTVSNDMRLAQVGSDNNKIIVKKGVLNARRIRTAQSGNNAQATIKTEVTFEVHEGGVINSDEIRLNERSKYEDSFVKILMLGGELNVSGALITNGSPGSSMLNLNGGTVNVGSLNVGDDFVVDFNGGTMTLAGDAKDAIEALSLNGQVTVAGITAMRGGLILDVDDEKTTITSDPTIVDVDKAWDPTIIGPGIDYDTAKLNWKAGDSTATTQGHEVYFGTDPNVSSVGKVDAPEIAMPVTLGLGQTYYYRVDQITTSGDVVEGNLWSFTVKDFIVIDDFESYTAESIDDPNAVFNFWQDGLVDADLGGSFSGHENPPFVETYDRWQGSQSLPIYYDNNDVVTTAQVKYMLPKAADWTLYGLKSLVLNFRGETGNQVGDVYVMINDVKVPYALAKAHFTDMWHTWVVNLADIDNGVLSNVASMSVGVDGANISGVLYIDNIRLTAEEAETMTAVAPSDEALLAQWKLDGNFEDSTGNGNHCSPAHGGPDFTWVDDSDLGSVWNANEGLGALCGTTFDPTGGTGSFTMSVWMKFNGDSTHPEDQDDIQHIFTKSDAWGLTTQMFQIEVKQDMWKNAGDAYKSGRMVYACGGVLPQREFHKVPVGEWSHNALVFDGKKVTGYLNGIPGVMSFDSGIGTKTDALIAVGNATTENNNWRGLNSLMSDMRIYAAPLTQAEIMSLAGRTDEVYK